MISDPIADMLTSLKNGYLARKKRVVVPYSKLKESLAQILVKEGYLLEVRKDQKGQKEDLILRLKYKDGKPALEQIRRVSKPSCRTYRSVAKLPRGLEITVVSTPKGLMTVRQARKKRLGGEVLCEIW